MPQVKVNYPDGMSARELESALSNGVPPELATLLREVRGVLGAVEQAVVTMSQSQRMSAEHMARAYRESVPTIPELDLSPIAAQVQQMTANQDAVREAITSLGSIIAGAVKAMTSLPAPQITVESPVFETDQVAPVTDLAIQRGDDGYMTGVRLVRGTH